MTSSTQFPALSPCQYYNEQRCFSCDLIEKPYDQQLAQKQSQLYGLFSTFLTQGGRLNPIIPSSPTFQSRTKAKFSVGGTSEKPTIGYSSSSGEVHELLHCPLHQEEINALINRIDALITQFRITPYQVQKKQGELKYIIIKSGTQTDEIMLRFVCRSDNEIENIRSCIGQLQHEFPKIVAASLNIQPLHQAILEGETEVYLSDQREIVDQIGRFQIGYTAQSFTQVTPNIAEQLYATVAKLVAHYKPDLMLDLFCGVGAFSIFCAASTQHSIGVEISASAIEVAKRNAARNALSQLEFIAADVDQYLATLQSKPDLVVINPPRRGLSESCCDRLKLLTPKIILYSSCNPETLLRDLTRLSSQYTLRSLTPFDMFPHTKHMEVLAELSLNT